MKNIKSTKAINAIIILSFCLLLIACDRSSSPEGRMTIKLEELQQQMLDSFAQQNQNILDSLSAIRSELNEIKNQK